MYNCIPYLALSLGGPITVPVIDQSKVMVSGNGIIQAAVNQKSTFHVNTQSAGHGELSAKIIGTFCLLLCLTSK